MAESRRKAESRKSKPSEKDGATDPRLARIERLALLLYLEGAVAIVVGMVVLSQFLSEGSPDRTILAVAGVLFGLMLVGMLATWMARRKAVNA